MFDNQYWNYSYILHSLRMGQECQYKYLSIWHRHFFSSLNHQLLSHIFNKAGFNLKVSFFFQNYLVGWKTQYVWNSFFSSFYNIDVGVGQGSALSSILSALYISLILHILENYLKILKIPISFLSFVDDGLLVAQNKSLSVLNSLLFCSYQIVSSLLDRFGLMLEYGKMEVFYFSRSSGFFNPPSLNLSPIGGPIPRICGDTYTSYLTGS